MPFPYLFPFYFEDQIPAQTFVIWVDNVDVTNNTLIGASLSYSLGAIGTLNISFESTISVALNSIVKVFDINTNLFTFSGTVREKATKQQTYNRYVYNCVAHDYTRQVYDSTGITGTFSGTNYEILVPLFQTYCPSVLVWAHNIDTGSNTTLTLENNSLSEALESLDSASSRIWWVDPYLELHFKAASNWSEGLFYLSDSPDFSTSYPYHSFEYTQDNISPTANTAQVLANVFYSGLQIGTWTRIVNSVIGDPFIWGNHYYITDILATLLNTINANIRWDFTIISRDSTTLPSVLTGHGSNTKVIPRLSNIPTPIKKYQSANKRYVDTRTRAIGVIAIDSTIDVTVANGWAYIPIPAALNGMNLTRAQAIVNTAGTTNATTIDIYNVTDSVDMLSGAISIASGATVGTVGTINASYDDVVTNDVLRVDVTTASTTKAKGLLVNLEFALP